MRFRDWWVVLAMCGALLLATPARAQKKAGPAGGKAPAAPQAEKKKSGSLGTKDPGLFNLTGSIYFLEKTTRGIPANLRTRTVEGTVYTDRIDVPVRSFTEGFPGVTDRFEWFGIVYTGRFFVDVPGVYTWSLQSDDGSRLWIDGKQVIDNDGVHGFGARDGRIELATGAHDVRLWYFQGPATEIGLRLWVTPPKGAKKVFDLADYAGPMAAAVRTLKAEATPDGIRIRLDAALLFDTAKWDLKPRAQQAIRNLGQVVAAYPAARIRVVGYTDAVGGDDYNLELSRSRAESVKNALGALGPPSGVTFVTEGLGKANPVATNDTVAGRALNRRVEVFIKPLAATSFEATALPEVQEQPAEKTARAAAEPGESREAVARSAERKAQVAAPPGEPAAPPPTAPAGRADRPPQQAERTMSPGPGPRPGTPEMIAAVNRVKYVVDRYARALAERDEATLLRVRPEPSDEDRALLGAERASVQFTVSTVEVSGTTATAACARTIEATVAGKAIRSSGSVVISLSRRAEGWIITAIK